MYIVHNIKYVCWINCGIMTNNWSDQNGLNLEPVKRELCNFIFTFEIVFNYRCKQICSELALFYLFELT